MKRLISASVGSELYQSINLAAPLGRQFFFHHRSLFSHVSSAMTGLERKPSIISKSRAEPIRFTKGAELHDSNAAFTPCDPPGRWKPNLTGPWKCVTCQSKKEIISRYPWILINLSRYQTLPNLVAEETIWINAMCGEPRSIESKSQPCSTRVDK